MTPQRADFSIANINSCFVDPSSSTLYFLASFDSSSFDLKVSIIGSILKYFCKNSSNSC